MPFSNDILIRVVILVLGLCGFMVAKRIRKHKKENAPLVCFAGFDCHTVVHSDYSRIFGLPVEILGMLYYAFVSISSFFFILYSNVVTNLVSTLGVAISFVALIFSIYLIFIQIFVLKKGCSWCIVSALISTVIFILTIYL